MNGRNNATAMDFDFLNNLDNKKDISTSKVFENPDVTQFINNIVKALNGITNIFRVSAYQISYVSNEDREIEILDIKKKKGDEEFKSYNIDKTIYHKLSLCITIDEKRLISDSELEEEQIRRANNKFVTELMQSDSAWNLLEDIGEYSYADNYQHSSRVVNIRIPDIVYSFVEIKNKVYYLTYNKFKKIAFLNPNKVQINRFSTNLDNSKARIIRPYYFISKDDESKIVNVEFDRKEFNLFRILNHFNIKNTLLKDFPNDLYLQATYDQYKREEKKKDITKAEFDKNLVIDAVLTLLGYIPPAEFKYYRYGSIIDSIAAEVVANIHNSLPRRTGKKGERYYHATQDDIEKALDAIEHTFKPNLFMAVMTKGDHEQLKSTYNENSVFYPMKVSKESSQIETIFKEEDLGIMDVYGTSQTKKNVLRVTAIPPFIDPKYIG